MNLKVLPYAAALALPAVASGAVTTLALNKLLNRNKPKETKWYDVQIDDETIRVLSIRL